MLIEFLSNPISYIKRTMKGIEESINNEVVRIPMASDYSEDLKLLFKVALKKHQVKPESKVLEDYLL